MLLVFVADFFNSVKKCDFDLFFTAGLQMHARCENLSRRENYFVILVLFDCVGVYVVKLAHESEIMDALASLSV